MLKWVRRITATVICTALMMIMLGPWAIYWLALSKIDGRPAHAFSSAFAVDDAELLWRKLREPPPIQVESMSPYSYLLAMVYGGSRGLPRGNQLAWVVARSYNTEHLKDRLWWHPSGAALTIWLTRNWTTDELIAKGIELDRTGTRPTIR